MSALCHAVGLALRRAAPASRLLGSGNTTVGLALRRSARLSHPPPSAASSRFLTTAESSNNTSVRMHCVDSGALDAAKVKVETNEAPAKFQGRIRPRAKRRCCVATIPPRVADKFRRSTKQIVQEAAVVSSGSGGRRRYRNHKEFLDRVVAPISFGVLLLHIMLTSRGY